MKTVRDAVLKERGNNGGGVHGAMEVGFGQISFIKSADELLKEIKEAQVEYSAKLPTIKVGVETFRQINARINALVKYISKR